MPFYSLRQLGYFPVSAEPAQKRQVVNQYIFNSLEVWYILTYVKVSLSEEFWSYYKDSLRQYLGDEIASKFESDEAEMLARGMQVRMVGGIYSETIQAFDLSYEDSVKELARFYPLDAYRMHTEVNVDATIANLSEVIDPILEDENLSDEDRSDVDDELGQVYEAIKSSVTDLVIDGIEQDMKKMLWKVNVMSHIRTWWYLRKLKLKLTNGIQELADDVAEKLLNGKHEQILKRKDAGGVSEKPES